MGTDGNVRTNAQKRFGRRRLYAPEIDKTARRSRSVGRAATYARRTLHLDKGQFVQQERAA